MRDPTSSSPPSARGILTDPGLRPQRYAATSRVPSVYAPAAFAVLGLLAMAAALILALAAAEPPRPAGTSASPDAFSVGRALPLLERLVGDGQPRPIGTAANAAARQRVIAELESLGLDVSVQSEFACIGEFLVCGQVENVLTRLPGLEDGPAVLLSAHYDSVGAGPGVSDDMVGVAAIIETVSLLQAQGPLRNPFIVLLADGEEVGLLGAEAFTRHPWFGEVGVVINLEARGTGGASLMFETNVDNAWLIDAFAREAPQPVTNSVLYEMYRMLPNDSDFSIYKRAGLNGLNFAYAEHVERYHTPLDDLEHLDLGSFQHQGDNLLAAARALGALDLSDPPAGNSIFMDLVPGSVLRAPESWAVPIAVASLLVWILIAVALARRGVVTGRRLLLGLLAGLLSVVLAAALGFGATTAVEALAGVSQPWYAAPVPIRVTVWLAATLGVLLVTSLVARRAGLWGLACGAWLLWSAAAVLSAVLLPGFSIMFLVPLVVASGLHLVASFAPRTVMAPLATLLAAFAAAYVWLPFTLSLELVAGMTLSPAVAALLALTLITLAPLFAQAPPAVGARPSPVRTAAMAAALVGVIVAGTLSLRTPRFTESKPQRFTIGHVVEALEGQPLGASWFLQRFPVSDVPASFAAIGDFRGSAATVMPGWVGENYSYAAAPLGDVTAPSIEVVRVEPMGAGRIVTLQLVAGGDGERLTLGVPGAAGATRLALPAAGYEMQLVPAGARASWEGRFMCHTAACDGLELELHQATTVSFEVTVYELAYGLPEGGAALQAARPATAVPSQDGDSSFVYNRVTVP